MDKWRRDRTVEEWKKRERREKWRRGDDVGEEVGGKGAEAGGQTDTF